MAFASCVTEDIPDNEGVAVGDSLPAFEVTLNDGSVVSNTSLSGKVGVIVFFSTNCSDCQRELPVVETVYRHFGDDADVMIFAISREENPGVVESFWKDYNLAFPYSDQTDRSVYNLFTTIGVPRIYISNKRGIIVDAYDDSKPLVAEELIAAIELCR